MFRLSLVRTGFSASLAPVLLLMSQSACASATLQPVHVTSISARDLGFDIFIEGNENPDGCSATGVIRVEGSVPNRSDLVATALTAFALGKYIRAYVNGCAQDGTLLARTVWMLNN